MSDALRIATRASELALRRARAIQAMLAQRGTASELVTFRTLGDKQFEEMLSPAGFRTTFTRELEAAVLKGKADLAVHALSDMSTDATSGLVVAAVPARDDPRDVLMLNRLLEATPLDELPRGSRIGTSSVRSRAFLRAIYPDLEVAHLRGDLPTRLHKVEEGQVHGTVVSAAALQRLGVTQSVMAYLEPPRWLPTPAQGASAIQIRDDDAHTRALVGPLNDPRTQIDTSAERAMLAALEGGLQSPVGALVLDDGAARVLYGAIADLEGRQILRAQLPMDDSQPELVGVRVANDLRAKGASRILDTLRRASRIPAPQPDT
jgi:hydroxymethylbilane synthase